ncbi:hypothetical protein BBJ28_00025388 [Nothophytophthora sp. Chile5]|nr:hypothetical protein BBJ28_00025388 [Nothophytophthora sp. Chile5]
MPPKLSFQPRISKKSKWLLRKKQRELAASAAGEPSLAASYTDRQSTSPLRLDVFSRLQQLSSHRESAASRQLQTEQQEASKTAPPAEWTVVKYDTASCSFILQGFNRPPATLP